MGRQCHTITLGFTTIDIQRQKRTIFTETASISLQKIGSQIDTRLK